MFETLIFEHFSGGENEMSNFATLYTGWSIKNCTVLNTCSVFVSKYFFMKPSQTYHRGFKVLFGT